MNHPEFLFFKRLSKVGLDLNTVKIDLCYGIMPRMLIIRREMVRSAVFLLRTVPRNVAFASTRFKDADSIIPVDVFHQLYDQGLRCRVEGLCSTSGIKIKVIHSVPPLTCLPCELCTFRWIPHRLHQTTSRSCRGRFRSSSSPASYLTWNT